MSPGRDSVARAEPQNAFRIRTPFLSGEGYIPIFIIYTFTAPTLDKQ